jgi:CubicO group peptidase (beta-lactamase class C family)
MERDPGSARKRIAIAAAGAVALATLAGCGTTGSGPSAAGGLRGELDAAIRATIREQGIVGLSAVVVSGGRRILASGYGFADRESRVPVTVDTVFPIASVTKLFTATAVMQMVERGAIDLDAPVSRYLPALARSGAGREPVVRELFTHHSGLTGNIMEGFELKEPDPAAFREVPRLLAGMPPAAAPGTMFAYCNAGYTLLGNLVEAAGTTGYVDAITRGILEPLGMDSTRFFLAPSDAEGAAMGYEDRTRVPVYPIRDIPAGGLLSTAADMERFMRFVFDRGGSGVLGRDAFGEMVRRQNAGVVLDGDFSIGLGYWLVKPIDVEDAFASHAGDIPPFHSMLVTIPERRIGVFLAVNSSRDPSALVPLAVELVRAAYADETGRLVPERPPTPRIRLDTDTLASLAGPYASPLGLLDIRAANGRLLTRVNGFPVEIVPREDGTFTAELSLLGLASIPVAPLKKVRFSRIASDGRTYLAITALGIMAGVAEKLPDSAVPEAWEARTGRYAIVERNANGNYHWPRDVSLEMDRRTGLLLLTYTFAGQRSSFPLRVIDDDEAAIAGTGTGLGDAVNAREEGREIFLEWAGLLLKRE